MVSSSKQDAIDKAVVHTVVHPATVIPTPAAPAAPSSAAISIPRIGFATPAAIPAPFAAVTPPVTKAVQTTGHATAKAAPPSTTGDSKKPVEVNSKKAKTQFIPLTTFLKRRTKTEIIDL